MKKRLLFALLLVGSLKGFGQCPTTQINLHSQAEVDAFATTYPGCTELLGVLSISGQDIIDLSGLSQITSTSSRFQILENPLLTSLDGLGPIEFLGDHSELLIGGIPPGNPVLTDISSLANATGSIDFLFIEFNPVLVDLSPLSGLSLTRAVGVMFNDALVNLNGLNIATSMESVVIEDCASMEDVSALSTVENIDNLVFAFLPSLVNLNGTENITDVKQSIVVYDCDSLISLDGLQGITNANVGMSQARIEISENLNLTDISAIENIDPESLYSIYIRENSMLSICNNLTICSYFNAGGSGVVVNNAPGCNTVQEILDSCVLSIAEVDLGQSISLYPIPVSERLNITIAENVVFEKAVVYTILGERLLVTSEKNIDFSNFSEGVYFVKALTDKGSTTRKIVKS